MKLFIVVNLLLALGLKHARADNSPTSISVGYQQLLTLGQQGNVTISAPENVFYSLSFTRFNPNGTTAVAHLMSNADNISKPYNSSTPPGIDPTTNETCIARVSTSPSPHNVELLITPQSSSDAWGYMVNLDLYYSSNYTYLYKTNSTNGREMVCITAPYITQQLKTDRHNITVWPDNGVTTTSFASGAFETGSTSYGQSLTESWPLSPPAAGAPFTSGAERVLGMSQTALFLLSAIVFLLLI